MKTLRITLKTLGMHTTHLSILATAGAGFALGLTFYEELGQAPGALIIGLCGVVFALTFSVTLCSILEDQDPACCSEYIPSRFSPGRYHEPNKHEEWAKSVANYTGIDVDEVKDIYEEL